MKRHKMNPYAAVVVVVLGASAAHADEIHVPAEQPTIQAAIGAAQDGDEIVLANGTYTGDGNKNLFFFGKTLTLRSASGDRDVCVIDCEGDGRFANLSFGNTVVFQSITVRNGNAGTEFGGAAVVLPGSSVSFIDCAFEGCDAFRGGSATGDLTSTNPTWRLMLRKS